MSARNKDQRAFPYFFLSYAHSAPLAGFQPEAPDYWVQRVFEDLCDAVCRAAGLDQGSPVGFFDGLQDPGADWNARAVDVLSEAQVFVPLYSPRYFTMSWPGREWACFTERLARTGIETQDEPSSHIIPVLWAPLTRATVLPKNAPDTSATIDDMPDYTENGLRALRMLNLYAEQYTRVVDRIGGRIVETVHERWLCHHPVPRLDQVSSAFRYKGLDDDFIVAIAAPTRTTVPWGRSSASWYEQESTGWRPFGEHEQLRLGDHAESVAERLNFSTAVLSAGAAADEVAAKPAVVLIDPWIAAGPDGAENSAVRDLRGLYASGRTRSWVLPVLVLNVDDAESQARKDELIARARHILREVGAPPAESAQRGDDVITSMDDFARMMPVLVAEAERRYLHDYLSGEDRPGLGGGFAAFDDEVWERPDGSGA